MRGIERRTFILGTGSALIACERGRTTSEPSASAEAQVAAEREGGLPEKAQPSPKPEPNAIPRRALGATGETVSALGLGGAHLGRPSEDEAIRLMHQAIDGGITFFDNCWSYHDGESERRMGKALRGSRRNQVFLMTKIDGRTYDAARQQIDQCLERLQTDRIDLMQVHEVIRDKDAPWVFGENGAMRSLREAKQAGKIRYIGFTGHKSPDIHLGMLREADAHGFKFDTVQMPLNVMDPHYQSFEKHVLPVLVEKKIGVLGMKSLGSGDILKTGRVTAEECLRYALSLPTSVVITGCEKPEILEQALRVGRGFQPLSRAQMDELLAKTAPDGKDGAYERFKTTQGFDSTTHNPHFMTTARF